MEQAGFWGYGQVMLEDEFRAPVAIVILSILFALGPHPPVGSALWPKFVFYFLTSITFGVMACFANSILPGLVVHVLGDLTFSPSCGLMTRRVRWFRTHLPDAWFWLHVAQAIAFTALAILAFIRLSKIAGRVRATLP